MTTVISVENLSKYYRLGTIGTGTLSHDLNRWWARLRGKPDPLLKIGQKLPVVSQQSTVNSVQSLQAKRKGLSSFIFHAKHSSFDSHPSDAIWALRDVSFEVKQGEVLGIIGRNGAGKSTLLKILSRVTAPTSGEVKLKGRIASLLEVGTGFHPELTGRENIYLNGAILGMSKREIARKFDEIVAFAEVEKFIDTPVKRYSSGMYVRLAFAVAAHLEPEILLVDEVLAVGDAAFQKKCLGKMGDVAREGRTVLFVSHNMASLLELCSMGLLFNQGQLVENGNIEDVTQVYLRSLRSTFMTQTDLREVGRPSNIHCRGRCRLLFFKLLNLSPNSAIKFGDDLTFEIGFEVLYPSKMLELGIGIFLSGGIEICSVVSSDDRPWQNLTEGTYRTQIRFAKMRLMPGDYDVGLGLRSEQGMEDYLKGTVGFQVIVSGEAAQRHTHYRKGVVVPDIEVNLETV